MSDPRLIDHIKYANQCLITELAGKLEAAEQREQELAAHVEEINDFVERMKRKGELWDEHVLVLATDRTPGSSLARRDAEKRAQGALAIRHLTRGEDWEEDELRAVIDDYVAGQRRQAETQHTPPGSVIKFHCPESDGDSYEDAQAT